MRNCVSGVRLPEPPRNDVEAFDEKPLPVAVADQACHRLLELVASLDPEGGADRRLTDINRVAAASLLH